MKRIAVQSKNSESILILGFDENRNDDLYSLFIEDRFHKLSLDDQVKSLQEMYRKCCDLNIEGGIFFRITETMGVDYKQELVKRLDELGFGWFNDEERLKGVGVTVVDYDFADYFCDMELIIKKWSE